MSSYEPLYNAALRLIGTLHQLPGGRTELYSPTGAYLGSHDPKTQRTYDAQGLVVGTGDQLRALLPGPNDTWPGR